VAFAANSLLCRLALRSLAIDPAGFTLLRLVSGAATLWLLMTLRRQPRSGSQGAWGSATALFVYAAGFSFAYVDLDTGTGALILFGAVQATMLLAGLLSGERLHALQWTGFVLAVGGLVYLLLPGVTAPPLPAALAMAGAGIAWGVYSLRGRGATAPVAATAQAFARTVPLAAALAIVFAPRLQLSAPGVAWAVLSGSVTSGLGYVVWYAAVRGLTATRAAIVQLAVPVLAAGAGAALLSETLSPRLILSGVVTLGGVALAVSSTRRSERLRPDPK
jgi:drug/metabolite transporter (DMT)-like permease